MDNVKEKLDEALNKDLVLREFLAIERTAMANYRTLLAFIRTGLYFVVAGSTLGQLIDTSFWKYLGVPCIIVGVLLVITGAGLYLRSNRKLKESKHQIGKVKDEFLSTILE